MQLRDKIVIVTGAGTGIGAALARQLWQAGAKVVLAGRRIEKLREVAAEAPEGAALCVATDVSVTAELEALRDAALAHFGAIDVLVNNAGIAYGPELETQSVDEINRQLAVNLGAPIQLTRLCLPVLKSRPEAMVVNVASMSALVGLPCQTVYAATKHGLRGFGAALRRELLETKIGVCTVYPTTVATELFDEEMLDQVRGMEVPIMSPEHVATQIRAGIERNEVELVVCTPKERLLPFMDRWFPSAIDRMARSKSRELSEFFAAASMRTQRRDAIHRPS